MAPCRDFQIFSQNFPLLLPARAEVVCIYKNFASFFVAKATPPHSLSKPSELQSEEQSSISKSTCERTCSMTYTVSPLIELDVSSKLNKLQNWPIIYFRFKHFINQFVILELQSEGQSSISKSTFEGTCSMTFTASPLLKVQNWRCYSNITGESLALFWSYYKWLKSKQFQSTSILHCQSFTAHSIVLQNWPINSCSIKVLHKCQINYCRLKNNIQF